MATAKAKYFFWFTALATIMACVPAVGTPAIATINPNVIGTFIVQTAHAAATQTSAALPTLTPSPTFTSTPRFTDTPEPSPTATVIFIFNTSTPLNPPTSTSATSDKSYACQVLSVTPANGTRLNSRTDFDADWRVKNIGKKKWDKNDVDYVYLSGDKFHKVAGYDLPGSVNVGATIDLIVDMVAPKNSGTYTTNWTLRVGSNNFCTLSLTINVP